MRHSKLFVIPIWPGYRWFLDLDWAAWIGRTHPERPAQLRHDEVGDWRGLSFEGSTRMRQRPRTSELEHNHEIRTSPGNKLDARTEIVQHTHRRGDEDHRHVAKLGRTFFKHPEIGPAAGKKEERVWTMDLDVMDDWAYPQTSLHTGDRRRP